MRVYVIALVAAWAAAGCTSSFECYSDQACQPDEVCNGGTCVVGERGVESSGGDFQLTGDTGPSDDNQPPLVGIVTPEPYELVSGEILIQAAVIDDVGVNPEGVTAVVMGSHEVQLLAAASGQQLYSGTISASVLGTTAAFPSLVVTAFDLAGNKGDAGIEFALDNRAPTLALESRQLQYYRIGTDDAIECSQLVEPLGQYALAPYDVVSATYRYGRAFFPRVRIQDRGNGVSENVPVIVSGIDPQTTKLYLLDKTGVDEYKLLVDNGAGQCMVNPAVIPDPDNPRADQAIVQNLVPAGPVGEPSFSPGPPAPPVNGPCQVGGTTDADESTGVDSVCGGLEPAQKIWMGYTLALDQPAVWMINDFDGESLELCAGGIFDAVNFSQDGYVCLAAVATDNLGNSGVSQPIVICVDRTASGACTSFDAGSVNLRNMCSDGCFDPTANRPPSFGAPGDLPPETKFWRSSEEEIDPGAEEP